MITTKYAFKQWLRKAYPEITATPIYGVDGYILNKPLKDVDNWMYNVQELPSGQYIVFIGVTIEEATALLHQIKDKGVPVQRRILNDIAPTTFSPFEAWLNRRNIHYINRTFQSQKTPSQCFNDPTYDKELTKRTWYMYELPTSLDEDNYVTVDGVRVDTMFAKTPFTVVKNKDGSASAVVLIKASNSVYKSKRQRFVEHFSIMQPVYEQLVICLAKGEDSKAVALASKYVSEMYEGEYTVDGNKLREAFNHGELTLFLRNKANCLSITDEFDYEG